MQKYDDSFVSTIQAFYPAIGKLEPDGSVDIFKIWFGEAGIIRKYYEQGVLILKNMTLGNNVDLTNSLPKVFDQLSVGEVLRSINDICQIKMNGKEFVIMSRTSLNHTATSLMGRFTKEEIPAFFRKILMNYRIF